MSGKNFRKNGPIGQAPHSGSSGSSFSAPMYSNTTAREHPAHQSGTNTKTKELKSFPSPGPLGTQGHGGAG